MWLLPLSAVRRFCAYVVMVLILAASIALFAVWPGVPAGLMLVGSAYRAVNLLRLARAWMNERYLRRVTVRTGVWLIGLQMAVLAGWWLQAQLAVAADQIWLAVVCADAVASIALLASSIRHARTTQPPQVVENGEADRDLPTLTVAIPARNETEDLDACLASLVASNYPKLEILVLDDCSQNAHTPEIIRSFAHAGVRFLQGSPPAENWLAKNQAYQQLLEQANGELVLFCGVDVRFQADSLRRLVLALLQKQKTMLSVIPINMPPAAPGLGGSTLLQPMRYAWELALPRKLFRRPPVLSTCWVARRDFILKAGGFAAVSHSITPESYFARASAVRDGYSLMQSDERTGIASSKSVAEQRATAVRTRYPQLHRRLELVLLVGGAELAGVLLPYIVLILAVLGRVPWVLGSVAAAAVIVLTWAYATIVALTYRRWFVRSLVLLPSAAAIDVALLHYSMIRYEFFEVLWKGRNVCIPVMHTTGRLVRPQRLR